MDEHTKDKGEGEERTTPALVLGGNWRECQREQSDKEREREREESENVI